MIRHLTFAALGRFGLARLYLFRREVATLWRAFFDPATPLYLKAAMLAVLAYLVSPIDLVPDVLPLAGWIDDLVLVPLAVSFIVRLLADHKAASDRPSHARG